MTAAEIVVRDENRVEARILLDNALLYQSRHSSRAAAEHELLELKQKLMRGPALLTLESDEPI